VGGAASPVARERLSHPAPLKDAREPLSPVSAGAAIPEKVKPDSDYRRRPGYQADFLPGNNVAMPALSAEQQKIAARNRQARADDDPFELKYTHFSAKLNAARRLAFFTATNIDGKNWKSVNRKTGEVSDDPEALREDEDPPGSEAREPWYEDPRVDDDEETNDRLYQKQTIDGRNPGQLRIFERGHLTRRQDPAWGSDAEALAADADTFHFSNCTPQIGFFNEGKSKRSSEARQGRSASGALHWRAIEDYVLDNARAEDLRVCVFTGPVLDDEHDIPWREEVISGFKVPREFWKIVVRVEHGELAATALCADQSPLIDDLPEARAGGFRDLSKVKKYQLSVAELERKTGLDFGEAVRRADTFAPGPEGRSAPLSEIGQIMLDRPRYGESPLPRSTGRIAR
jgi:endonuclease G